MSLDQGPPTRLVELPPKDSLHPLGELFRSATQAPEETTPLIKWRVRSTLRDKSKWPRRALRVALVGGLLFVTGGVVGAVARPFLGGWIHATTPATANTPTSSSNSPGSRKRTNSRTGEPTAAEIPGEESVVSAELPPPLPTEPLALPDSRDHGQLAEGPSELVVAIPSKSTAQQPEIGLTGSSGSAGLKKLPIPSSPIPSSSIPSLPPSKAMDRSPVSTHPMAVRTLAHVGPISTSAVPGREWNLPVDSRSAPVPVNQTSQIFAPPPQQSPAVTEVAPVPPPPQQPPAVTEVAPVVPEQTLLTKALRSLRSTHNPLAALAALDEYSKRFPNGALGPEASMLRAEAFLLLDRKGSALAELDKLTLDGLPNSDERRVLRGELRAASGRWRAALADFQTILAGFVGDESDARSHDRIERAMWGRASARSHLGDDTGARADVREYLRYYPKGRFAAEATRLLSEQR
jgi:hypothetical protein